MTTTRGALRGGLLVFIVMVAGCGENRSSIPPTPTGPSTLLPLLLPQLSGIWGGPVILTSVAGGTGPARDAGALECVGAAYDAVVGETNDSRLIIAQSGLAVTASLASAATGLACAYSGRIGSASSLELHASSCEASTLLFRCPPDPNGNVQVRHMQLVGSSISATFDPPVNVASISGTVAHTYNVLDATGEGAVGTVVLNHVFTSLTRR